MSCPAVRRALLIGLVLTAFSVAPAPPDTPRKSSALAEARYKAAIKQFADRHGFWGSEHRYPSSDAETNRFWSQSSW